MLEIRVADDDEISMRARKYYHSAACAYDDDIFLPSSHNWLLQ
jgi:hypothetical protein